MTEPKPVGSYPSILIVDDESSTLSALNRFLHYDYQVTKAATAEEALGCIDAGDVFDIILCDIELGGGMGGVEFYEFLSIHHPKHAHRVVFVGGGDPPNLPVLFIPKPFAIDDLIAILKEFLDARGRLSRP